MLQFLAIIVIMVLAVALFAGGLHFSKYKKRPNAGCCGGGHCESGGNKHSCYSSKEEFVDNFDKIKADRLKV